VKLRNQAKFNLQKSFCDFEISIKSYRQNSKRGTKEQFFWHFQTPSLNFVHNFWVETWNHKRIFGDGNLFDFPTFSSSNFLEKNDLLCRNGLHSLLNLQNTELWMIIYKKKIHFTKNSNRSDLYIAQIKKNSIWNSCKSKWTKKCKYFCWFECYTIQINKKIVIILLTCAKSTKNCKNGLYNI